MTTKLRNILHCYAMGMGIKGISATFELSRNTVRKYVRLFQERGIPIEQLLQVPAKRLEEMFGGSGERERTPSVGQLELEALLPEYAARLTRKGVTVKSLYEEYRKEHPGGFRHASFGAYIQRYRLVSRRWVTLNIMPQTRCILTLRVTACRLLMIKRARSAPLKSLWRFCYAATTPTVKQSGRRRKKI